MTADNPSKLATAHTAGHIGENIFDMLFLTRFSDLFGQEREQLAKALEALEPFWANYPDLRKCCFQRRDRRVVLGNPEEPTASRRSQKSPPSQEPRGWYSRGYLPHFDGPGLIQYITFHLADSLPREAIDRMQRALELLPEEERSIKQRKRIEDLLDSGLGSCALRQAACARLVEEALLFGDGNRYRLLAWVIMPNHVHVLIEQKEGWPLAKVVQSWKRHTSREIHRLGSTSCTRHVPSPLWQRDYWDRFLRNEQHLLAAIRYIESNPVVAGLSGAPEDWQWGGARFGRNANAEYNSAIPGQSPGGGHV